MEQRPAHPLDIDLLGVALGDSDATVAAEVRDMCGRFPVPGLPQE